MEATWIGFHLWAAAVEAAGATDVDKVRAALAGRRIAAPSGFTVQMDGKTQHLHKPVMIGRITADGRIVPVSVSRRAGAAEPVESVARRGASFGAGSGGRHDPPRLRHCAKAIGA